MSSGGSSILPRKPQDIVLGDGDDHVWDQAMGFLVDRRQVGRRSRLREAERRAGVGVEPVRHELNAVLRRDGEIEHVSLRHLLWGDARDIVAVHE